MARIIIPFAFALLFFALMPTLSSISPWGKVSPTAVLVAFFLSLLLALPSEKRHRQRS